jgi:integrase
MSAMLTLQRRHSQKCPDRNKGPNYLKCRGHCSLRICGMVNEHRVRKSLKTRDLQRAARRLAEIEQEALGRPRKPLMDAIEAFHDHIGRANYERLRARAMVLLMRYAGLRVSDVVTLSRDHIQGRHLVKRAIKNHRPIRVELHPDVLKALDVLPHPKAAAQDCRLYFSGGNASVRSLVKGAQRTLAAVFTRAKVNRGYPHRFRHSLASEILGKGGTVEEAAGILADSSATIRRHYAKWTPEYQARQDRVIRLIHGTNLAQAGEQVSKC